MEIITDIEQGTPEWLSVRAAIPTASMFSAVMAKGQGKTRRSYMLKLIGERITGEPDESYTNAHMERGHIMEVEAREDYAFTTGLEPIQVGFIRNGDTGCSPDALVGNDGILEIKSKLPHLQLDVLLKDEMPTEHKAQVQGELWITEREWVDFVSYWPRLPLFVKRIYRDEDYIKTIVSEVARFNEEMNEIEQKIRSM